MAIKEGDITWVALGDKGPERTHEGDQESWSVWVDNSADSVWVAKNAGYPLALITMGLGDFEAWQLVSRLYEMFGTDKRIGLIRVT